VQNGTNKLSSELHRYPAVDTHRKRKLRDDNITENVSWRVPIWYRTFRVSILFSIHTDYIDLEYNIAYIRIEFSDKTITEIQHVDSLHLSTIYERAYQMPITGIRRTFQTVFTRQTTPLALPYPRIASFFNFFTHSYYRRSFSILDREILEQVCFLLEITYPLNTYTNPVRTAQQTQSSRL
jgi:hypothetical protein